MDLFNESPSNGIMNIPASYALDNESERPQPKGALAQLVGGTIHNMKKAYPVDIKYIVISSCSSMIE